MLNFSKSKIFAITLACLLSLWFALPSFFEEDSETLKKFSQFLPSERVNLGLDLRGGSQLVLQVDFDYYLEERLSNIKSEIKKSFYDERIRALPKVSGDKITFKIVDSAQEKDAKKLIRKISKDVDVEVSDGNFEIFFTDSKIDEVRQNLVQQSIEIIRRRIDESGTREPTIQAQGQDRILLQVPGVKDSAELKSVLGKTAKMTFHFVDDRTFSSTKIAVSDPRFEAVPDDSGRMYLIDKEAVLTGDMLTNANTTYHEGEPAVAFTFNEIGARKFAQITRDNIGKFFAIVLDGKIVTAPRINSVINQGSGVISGNFTIQEANEVALLLRAGALPAPLAIIEERVVGPSLGKDSIKSGSVSIAFGLLFVAIFMIFFYRFFGFVANIALIVNVLIILAFLSLIGATLTLPGMAGIVLTMGMAVDANVLIFERIKEELRIGRKVFAAVENGFNHAYRTIVDSNITTLIVAFFLYFFGNGPVKGFAVTLSIGIVASMFSAVLLTRMLIAIWLRRKRPTELNLF